MRRIVRVPREAPPDGQDFDPAYVQKLAKAYKSTKDAITNFTRQADKIKGELTQYVERHGEPDDQGHLWLDVDGFKLKRERRVSRTLDVQAAEAWAKENGYWEEVSEVIPEHRELSEDKLLKLAWETLGEAEVTQTIASFYVEREVWAFKANEVPSS